MEDQTSSIKLLINQLFNEVLILETQKKKSEDDIANLLVIIYRRS